MKRISFGGTRKGSALVVEDSRRVFIVKDGGVLRPDTGDQTEIFKRTGFSRFQSAARRASPLWRTRPGGRRRGQQKHGPSTTGGSGHLPPAKPRKTFSAKGIEDHLHRASCQLLEARLRLRVARPQPQPEVERACGIPVAARRSGKKNGRKGGLCRRESERCVAKKLNEQRQRSLARSGENL